MITIIIVIYVNVNIFDVNKTLTKVKALLGISAARMNTVKLNDYSATTLSSFRTLPSTP